MRFKRPPAGTKIRAKFATRCQGSSLSGWQRLVLIFFQPLDHVLGETVEQFEDSGIGPAEADYIHFITKFDVRFRGPRHDIVLFLDRAIATEIFPDGRQELVGNAVGVRVETVSSQTIDR